MILNEVIEELDVDTRISHVAFSPPKYLPMFNPQDFVIFKTLKRFAGKLELTST